MLRFNQVFEGGLHFHYDILISIIAKQQNQLINQQQQSKQYKEHLDDTNIIEVGEFFRNSLSILIIGLTLSLITFIIELY